MTLTDIHLFRYLRGRPPGEKRFLLLVPAVGVLTGLVAAGLVHLLAAVQQLFWGSPHELLAPAQALSPLHRFLAPTIGGVLVGLIILIHRGRIRGHGTSGIIEAVARGKGRLPVIPGLADIGAILVTVGSGGSLGREGSLLRAGSTLGSFVGRRLGLTGPRLTTLLACGAAAGMAAAYNAPIGGAMFAMEVILGTFALESFGPIVVASAIGTLISRSLIHPYLAYTPPPYPDLVSGWELAHYVLLGAAVGLASVGFLITLKAVARGFAHVPIPLWSQPIVGFALVGAIGVGFPQVFGNGYDTVDLMLHGQVPLKLILVLPFLKIAATALTRGSGGSGGLFTPTLFIGAALGSSYGAWCQHAFPGTTASPAAYALAGMGAMLAGTTQAPLTAILVIFELTGEYAVILPLMIACTAAIIVCRLLRFESIYTQPLLDRGVLVGGRVEELVMDRLTVRDLMRASPQPVRADDTLDVVLGRLRADGRKELFVVGADERLRGSITLGDLTEYLTHPESLGGTRAGEVAYAGVPVLQADDKLTDAIGRWSQVSRDRLPVVDGTATRRLIGELSAGDIFTLYNQEILHKEARLARFVRSGEPTPETTFVELPEEYVVAQVALSPGFEGATVGDVGLRARFSLNIIEIKRPLGGERWRRIIPDRDTRFQRGDALVVVGRPADIARLSDPVRMAELKEALEPRG